MEERNRYLLRVMRDIAEHPKEYDDCNRLGYLCDINRELVRNFLCFVLTLAVFCYSFAGVIVLIKNFFRR